MYVYSNIISFNHTFHCTRLVYIRFLLVSDHVYVIPRSIGQPVAFSASYIDGETRNVDGDPICATIEVLRDNCFGRDQHVSNRNSNNGTVRSTSLNSDAVGI